MNKLKNIKYNKMLIKSIVTLCILIILLILYKDNKYEIFSKEIDSTIKSNDEHENLLISKKSQDNIQASNKNFIEIKSDIDADDELEKIVLCVENKQHNEEIYNNIKIYDYVNKIEEKVFDLNEEGYSIDGNYINNTKELIVISDNNKDDIVELYFEEWAYASDPPRKLIIQKIDNEYKILFFDKIYDITFEDIDGDELLELYGQTVSGGQTSINKGFVTVFKMNNYKYKASYGLTRELVKRKTDMAEKEFKDNPSFEALNKLGYQYAYMGSIDKCKELIKNNQALINGADCSIDDKISKYIIFRCVEMAELYSQYWESLKEQEIN